MKISPYNYNSSFTSLNDTIKRKNLTIEQRELHPILSNPNVEFFSNYTCFFRQDVGKNWKQFSILLNDFFKNVPQANVYSFGCSDGSEAYSVTMSLIDTLGKNQAKKFFPIKAFDIDFDAIQQAKSGKISCDEGDVGRIEDNLDYSISRYGDLSHTYFKRDYPYLFDLKEDIKKQVEFNQGDFLEQIDNIESSNSLLLCRNFWYYLGEDNIESVFNKLADKIDHTSLLVIGDFDRKYLLKHLKNKGFNEITLNVFAKTAGDKCEN